MPGNSFFDQIVQAIEQAQKEATATQRASKADVDKARKEMAREKMKKEKEAKEREEKAKKEKAPENSAPKPLTGEESKSPLGEKFNARKMVIYSEIMNPKYKD